MYVHCNSKTVCSEKYIKSDMALLLVGFFFWIVLENLGVYTTLHLFIFSWIFETFLNHAYLDELYNHVSVVFSFEEDTIAWYYNGWTSRITKLVMNLDFFICRFFCHFLCICMCHIKSVLQMAFSCVLF